MHVLQIILGTVEVPGGFRFKPPYPKPSSIHSKPHCKVTPGAPLDGPHLGFVHGPEDLCLKQDGSPARIDKAFTWENPMSAHGLMHMVISNAHAGAPYKIDTLFMYMANMSWNSSMNTKGVIKMLTDTTDSGDYVIPHIIYSDAYSSEMVAYADLILPDTTYLERHDCISLLDRPICEADAVADSIRWPVIKPDRDVRGFQSVLCDLGARLKLPGFIDDDGNAKFKDYADYIVNHERKPGIGPLAGWRSTADTGKGPPNQKQLELYIKNGGFWTKHIPQNAAYYKPWNLDYQNWAVYHKDFTDSSHYYAILNHNYAEITGSNPSLWNNLDPTSTEFSLWNYNTGSATSSFVNQSDNSTTPTYHGAFIAYLFATLSGISKVGSFSHTNGSSTNVDCGFGSTARFVMVKSKGIGDWYVWDSVRGISAGNDSYLRLNTSDAPVTTTDWIDPLSTGFQMSSGFATGNYIFYALA